MEPAVVQDLRTHRREDAVAGNHFGTVRQELDLAELTVQLVTA